MFYNNRFTMTGRNWRALPFGLSCPEIDVLQLRCIALFSNSILATMC
jgi:hypothetical protein